MRTTNLGTWRLAVLTSLGLFHACGGQAFNEGRGKEPLNNPDDGGDDTTEVPDDDVGSGTGGGTTKPGPGLPVPSGGATHGPGGTGGASMMPPVPVSVCEGAEKQIAPGLFECESGVVHRAAPSMCKSELPRDVVHDGGQFFSCKSDAECTERAHGYCETYAGGNLPEPGASCNYGCTSDADCGEGMLCECGSPVGQCVAAHDCKVDADCGEAGMCARYSYDNGCGPTVGYACKSADDQCTTNADCEAAAKIAPPDGLPGGNQCAWTPEGRRCQGFVCAIGRPFLVQGGERMAQLSARKDWAEACEGTLLQGALAALSAAQRQQLGDEWARVGLMEHASIAAFARFSLQLLSLGAPPSLVEACNQAMVDETQHARLAFGLATEFSGHSVGPGKLKLDHALDEDDFESIVLNTVLEGCIGETVAAVEARELLARAQDPAVQKVLSQIAQDEQRHADLAWQFVRWALGERPELASRASRLVHAEQERSAASLGAEPKRSWMGAFGVMSQEERATLRASVLAEVVVPCVEALAAQTCDTSRGRELALS